MRAQADATVACPDQRLEPRRELGREQIPEMRGLGSLCFLEGVSKESPRLVLILERTLLLVGALQRQFEVVYAFVPRGAAARKQGSFGFAQVADHCFVMLLRVPLHGS